MKKSTILGVMCALLCCLLTAGLWPFHAPSNRISWSKGNGVHFDGHATIISSENFRMPGSDTSAACSLEMWIQPLNLNGGSTLLAFDTSDSARFSLRQSNADVVLRHGRTEFYVENVFRPGEPILLTITAGGGGAKVYVDGRLVRSFPFPMSSGDFSGRLVLGTSPVKNDDYTGELNGLAFYRDKLTPSEINRHYQTWARAGRPEVAPDRPPVALYLFNEGQGRIVHNSGTSRVDLEIPAHYHILHQIFLERPWTEFHANWNYCKDILINVGGLVPFGFFLFAYLTLRDEARGAVWQTVLAGFCVSLTIEILQSFLPTRFSGITDLFTNTLGTWIGVALYKRLMRNPEFLPIPFVNVRNSEKLDVDLLEKQAL